MSDAALKRVRVFCTIREDLEAWVKQEIERGTFRNRSDALEKGLLRMREAMKERKE